MPSVIGGEADDYILKVRGDSMKDAGILEGDFVVVRPTDEAANGEIVVALLGDEATVKRFYRERNAIRLEPENEAHEPIRTQDAELLGKVIGVFRQVMNPWPPRNNRHRSGQRIPGAADGELDAAAVRARRADARGRGPRRLGGPRRGRPRRVPRLRRRAHDARWVRRLRRRALVTCPQNRLELALQAMRSRGR